MKARKFSLSQQINDLGQGNAILNIIMIKCFPRFWVGFCLFVSLFLTERNLSRS